MDSLLKKIESQSQRLVLKRDKRVPATAVIALALSRVAIDERAMIHRMAQAPHFMFQSEFLATILRIDDIFEAELMIAHVLGNQSAALQETVRFGKTGDVNGNMVAIVRSQSFLRFAEN